MFRLYWKLISASIRAQMQYKLNFITSVTTTALLLVLDFLVLAAILYRFDDVQGWDIYEVGLLYGISSTAFSLYRLFAPEIHDFERYVLQGEFDSLLLRPVSPLLLLLTRQLDLSRLGGVVQGIAVLLISLIGIHSEGRSILSLVLFAPVGIVAGTMIYFSISLGTATLSFWTHQIKDLQTFTLYAPSNAANYPISLYPGWLKWLFFSLIPVAFMHYFPMLTLLDKGGSWYYPLLTPVVSALALGLSLSFWRFGIRHYHSTGS